MADIEQAMLQQLAESGTIPDSGDFAKALQQDPLKIVGTIKSLIAAEMITVEVCYLLCKVLSSSCSCAADFRNSPAHNDELCCLRIFISNRNIILLRTYQPLICTRT